MGSFVTNLQVRASDAVGVAAAIRATIADLDDVADGGPCDREILVLPPDAGGWVAVYDQATEMQDGVTLDALGTLLSKGTLAFSVTVHDSDVLFLSLYDDGRVSDRYDSHPAYFGRVSKKRRAEVLGHPARWAGALARGASAEQLEAAWRAEDLFAEATLRRTAELLGCDPTRAASTRGTFATGSVPEGAVTLRLRGRTRPGHERARTGPPLLGRGVPTRIPLALGVGDEVRIPVTGRNEGGPGRGLRFEASGDVVANGHVSLERIELLVGNPRDGARHAMHPLEQRQEADGPRWIVELPDEAIPAGASGFEGGFRPGMDLRAMMDAQTRAQVHANLVGRVLAPGRGTIHAALVPTEHPSGAVRVEVALELAPAFDRPLRATERLNGMPGGSAHLLRPLAGDDVLVALASIDAPRATGAAIAVDALRATIAILGTDGAFERATFRSDPGKRPTTAQGTAAKRLGAAGLAELERLFVDEQATDVTVGQAVERARDMGAPRGRWGLGYGGNILPQRDDEHVPTLSLWASTRGLAPDVISALRAAWIEIVERALAAGGPQGVVLRSGWAPQSGYVHYETVVETPQGLSTARDWVRRFVRVPGNDRLWLGPSLAAHVDRAALAAIADVTERDGTLAIALRDPKDWRALEDALAPVLATAAEAHAFTNRWYGR